jgi:hypothetical protein
LDWNFLGGAFTTLNLPTLNSGLVWNTSQLDTTGILSVVSAGFPGDYNSNGTVDAADYVIWRKNPGSIHTPDDYNTWRTNFGQTFFLGSGPAAPNSTAIPEPTKLVLLIFAAAGWCLRRGRHA